MGVGCNMNVMDELDITMMNKSGPKQATSKDFGDSKKSSSVNQETIDAWSGQDQGLARLAGIKDKKVAGEPSSCPLQ